MPDNNPVENIFMSFCKQLLGVQKQTTNVGVLLELGQVPLVLLAQKKALKNWVRIVNGENCNPNTIDSYCSSISEHLPWAKNILQKLSEIDMRELFFLQKTRTHIQRHFRGWLIFFIRKH